jgi:hypothetical protein
VIAVGIVSGASGFFLRGLLRPVGAPPAAVAQSPSWEPLPLKPVSPPPPVAVQVPVPERPRAEPIAAPVAPPPAPLPAATPAVATPEPPPAPLAPPPVVRKRIVVPYRALEGSAQRIIVPVTFNGRVTAPMAVDTGAPGMHITFPLAARIGVLHDGDSHLITQAAGIGGRSAAALVVLDSISVGEARTDFVPATVTEALSDAFEGLVGMDFIAGYAIQIDTQQHVLVLTELPPSGDMPGGHDEAWWRRTFGELMGQQTLWQGIRTRLKDRQDHSSVSAGTQADELRQLVDFSISQAHEAQVLVDRLERYAANNAVPREWRR